MQTREQVTVQRDIETIQIPDGTRVPLSAGSDVVITQALGGSYTVMTPYGLMVRVDEKDADALGKEVPEDPTQADQSLPLEEKIWNQMRKCYDPEIPVNIVDLGLIYDAGIEDLPGGGKRVSVKMTLTAPGCGMGDILADDVKRKIEELEEVQEADIEVVFDPQWSMDMMTEAARLQLGLM